MHGEARRRPAAPLLRVPRANMSGYSSPLFSIPLMGSSRIVHRPAPLLDCLCRPRRHSLRCARDDPSRPPWSFAVISVGKPPLSRQSRGDAKLSLNREQCDPHNSVPHATTRQGEWPRGATPAKKRGDRGRRVQSLRRAVVEYLAHNDAGCRAQRRGYHIEGRETRAGSLPTDSQCASWMTSSSAPGSPPSGM
jgi:hypothetical protein